MHVCVGGGGGVVNNQSATIPRENLFIKSQNCSRLIYENSLHEVFIAK